MTSADHYRLQHTAIGLVVGGVLLMCVAALANAALLAWWQLPIYVGAAMIAVAILLSTLISGLTGRYVGLDGPNDENMWLVDRLTGSVYRCQAEARGKASCEQDMATGSVGDRSGAPKGVR